MTTNYHAPPGPHIVLAIDLGKRKCGLAAFIVVDGKARLLDAQTVHADLPPEGDPEAMADALLDAAADALQVGVPVVAVLEWPQKYDHLRARHERLDDLHAVGHALSRRLNVVAKYRPAEWKGNVPKDAHHRRLQRELCSGDAAPPPPSDATHDAWDAVGIGLYATGRTRRGGTRA